jgi:hypothetical protein
MSETAAPAASAPTAATGPPGQLRNPWKLILLAPITLGIYFLIWEYKTYEEMKQHTGEGLGGLAGVLLGIIAPWKIPAEIANMYRRAGEPSPVSWKTGFWMFVPLVWPLKVQNALNEYWVDKIAPE